LWKRPRPKLGCGAKERRRRRKGFDSPGPSNAIPLLWQKILIGQIFKNH
jgi:hypothetical protein